MMKYPFDVYQTRDDMFANKKKIIVHVCEEKNNVI